MTTPARLPQSTSSASSRREFLTRMAGLLAFASSTANPVLGRSLLVRAGDEPIGGEPKKTCPTTYTNSDTNSFTITWPSSTGTRSETCRSTETGTSSGTCTVESNSWVVTGDHGDFSTTHTFSASYDPPITQTKSSDCGNGVCSKSTTYSQSGSTHTHSDTFSFSRTGTVTCEERRGGIYAGPDARPLEHGELPPLEDLGRFVDLDTYPLDRFALRI